MKRAPQSLLLTVAGRDAPGIAARLFTVLASLGVGTSDVEQVRVHGRLLLCMELEVSEQVGAERVRAAIAEELVAPDGAELTVSVEALGGEVQRRRGDRLLVTVLSPALSPGALAGVFGRIASCGGNVERIVQLARYPVTSYELVVGDADPARLRRELSIEAARQRVDVAVQRAGLHRRAKHLIVLDVDSTLLQGEVIDLLAARTGHTEEVAALTHEAMAGGADFADALVRRVALLKGLQASEFDAVRAELQLAPGARTLVRTLKRLGYVTAIVSGGFLQVIEGLAAELGIDHVAANVLEVAEGRLTGRLEGPVIGRAGKAAALVRFAELSGVPLTRTVAVGDGANDLDMLATAGLGIAFNAKPLVRDAADTALNVPYLDAILYLLGITREEIESADVEDSFDAPHSG